MRGHQNRGSTEARKHADPSRALRLSALSRSIPYMATSKSRKYGNTRNPSAPSAFPRFRVQFCPTRPFNSRYPFAASSPCSGIRIAETRGTFRALRPSALPRSILPKPSVQFPRSVVLPSAPPRFRVQFRPTRPFNSLRPLYSPPRSSLMKGAAIATRRLLKRLLHSLARHFSTAVSKTYYSSQHGVQFS